MKIETLSFTPHGRLRIFKQDSNGICETLFEDDNLIVTSGRAIILDQLHYTVGSGDPITHAKVGTGGALDVDGLFLKVPTVDMTDLYNPVTSASVVKTDSNPSIPSITLLASLDSSAGNGNFINEAGFFSASNRMFNIKVFPGIAKTSSFSLNFEWVIKML